MSPPPAIIPCSRTNLRPCPIKPTTGQPGRHRTLFSRDSLPAMVVSCLALLILAPALLPGKQPFTIDRQILQKAEKSYGPGARNRLLAWQRLIREGNRGTEREKLERVNRFFNRMHFIDDTIHWRQEDYWATPVEFLASNGGDCEDFALAKYFTLRALDVPEDRLYLTYVKAIRLNRAHMVLAYYPEPGAVPLVLDNLTGAIEPASKRTDLVPVYSFNGKGLWLAKQRGRGRKVGGSDRLSRWQQLLARMPDTLIRPNHAR